ncbi:MAG: HTH domain-containing protein [Faecalicoccus sp.]|nr:HTH domain-containing protein [Faecalicoccus sp.]
MITLSKNEIAILQVLMASDNYHSSYEIASLTGISRRSVRNFIPDIKTFLQMHGIELQSQANKGYRVSIKDPALRANLVSELSVDSKNSAAVSEDLLNRHIFIMRSLIQSDTYIRADDLADQLMLSRSAINPLIKEVRKLLKKKRKIHIFPTATGDGQQTRMDYNTIWR